MTYRLCRIQIEAKRLNGMAEKLDVLYVAGRLATEEYNELVALLASKTAEVQAQA